MNKHPLRLAIALLVLGLLVQIIGAVWYFTSAASRVVSVPPETLTTYAGIIRRPSTGAWQFVAESAGSHVVSGFTRIYCDTNSGILHVLFPMGVEGGVKNVASAWVQHDETMGRRGVIAGPSIGKGDMRILFTRITSAGPQRLSCNSSYLRGDSANFWIGLVGQPYETTP